MLMCPWCEAWEPRESYIILNLPERHTKLLELIVKHGGENGCKKLFAVRGLAK